MLNDYQKVLFISPRKTCALGSDEKPVQKMRSGVSLSGLTILGVLENSGFETDFIDMAADDMDNQQKLNGGAIQYGMSTENVIEYITEKKPGIILITSMFTSEQMVVDELVRSIKKIFPSMIIILGGIHASIKPEWHFEESSPDFIVLGEGEETIVQLLRELNQQSPRVEQIPGIAYRNSQGVIEKTSTPLLLSKLIYPWAYQSVLHNQRDESRYVDSLCRKHSVYASSKICRDASSFAFYLSRGCRIGCFYCPAMNKDGNDIRHMGVERAFTQFKLVREIFNVEMFANQSDSFCVSFEDREFLKGVSDYRKTTGDEGFVINNPNAFFLHTFFPPDKDYNIDLDLLDLLVGAGFNTITIAIETLTPRFNKKVNWNRIKPEQVIELCQLIHRKGLCTDIYMMYGFPGQTLEEFDKDVKFGEALGEYVDFVTWNGLTLLPGTRYYFDYVESRSGGENEYRKTMRSGLSWHYPLDVFNLSQVPAKVFCERIAPFGQSWI
jgi:radical SAM superfamily enzyme YgiQ (UPF0313 family)